MCDLKIESISKMNLKENDILVLRIGGSISNKTAGYMKDYLASVLEKAGYKNQIIILEKDCNFEIMGND